MDLKLSELQNFIKTRDHRPDLKLEVMLKLVEEVGELACEVRKINMDGVTTTGINKLKLEMYDCMHYLVHIANIYDIDLNETIELKDEINKKRYKR